MLVSVIFPISRLEILIFHRLWEEQPDWYLIIKTHMLHLYKKKRKRRRNQFRIFFYGHEKFLVPIEGIYWFLYLISSRCTSNAIIAINKHIFRRCFYIRQICLYVKHGIMTNLIGISYVTCYAVCQLRVWIYIFKWYMNPFECQNN